MNTPDAPAEEPAPARGAMPFGRYERMIAARYLRSTRSKGGVALISIIAFVGIMLAVFVLITVMSVMNGFRHELLSKVLGVEPHARVFVRELPPDLVSEVVVRLEAAPSVASASPVVSGQGLLTTERGASSFVAVFGVEADALRGLELIAESVGDDDILRGSGSLATFGSGDRGGDGIVLGQVLADQLGVGPGDLVTLLVPSGAVTAIGTIPRRKSYEVVATFFVGNQDFDSQFAFMPVEQAQIIFGFGEDVEFLDVRVADPDALGRRVDPDSVISGIAAAAAPYARVADWRDRYQSFFNALRVERNVMRLLLALVVLIAAMNIISGLVMLAKNKSRDIAILRTMGATQASILRIFLMAGAVIGVSSTIVGVALGVLFCSYIGPIQSFVEWLTGFSVFPSDVYILSGIPARIEWREVWFVAAWGLFSSCVAALPAAWRAARLEPVEALRYE